ncbi:DUF305 domain-containing protein [Almyronema epifaneia]|uniref:DUF305 domain-containing protein n=1 Tax=Almyronema epifaneia S1 TaxID=2991925 RepID=A0ABW6IEY6_9CYAN
MRLKRALALGGLGSFLVGSGVLTGCNSLSSQVPTLPTSSIHHPAVDHAMTMDLGPKDADFDLRFIDGMILHHQGAIAMAEAALQNSQRDQVKQLAQAIIAAQQSEISQLQQWRQAWYPNAGSEPVMYHAQMGHTMAMTPEMQVAMRMDGGLGEADADFDLRFIDGMIPHHEGALAMAKQVIENSDRPELKALAQAILATQQSEIDQMNQWRQDWYGQPAS